MALGPRSHGAMLCVLMMVVAVVAMGVSMGYLMGIRGAHLGDLAFEMNRLARIGVIAVNDNLVLRHFRHRIHHLLGILGSYR